MKKIFVISGSILLAWAFLQCKAREEVSVSPESIISSKDIQAHVAVLASDSFQGRMPFTEGETKTVNYLISAFESMGIPPGNDGSYVQEVPMVEIVSEPVNSLQVSGNGFSGSYAFRDEFVALSRRVTDQVEVKHAELVFCGFGIVAPEYDWNDYDGIDMNGKIAVVLVNDPGFGDDDESFFRGNTMTYYGRWTYKYEEAARQGAAGCLIVHNTLAAGYPWGVVRNGWTGANLYLDASDGNMDRCKFEGWVQGEVARELFAVSTLDEDMIGSARTPGFKPVSMGLSASLTLNNRYKKEKSKNVVALLKGEVHPDEVIIYTAHWDHLGIGEANSDGDSIYNGAVDNAGGTAMLLEIADAFASMPSTERSVMFLAVTAEEQGLLGSEYYAANPIFPPSRTVANINMDAVRVFGKTKAFMIFGSGNSELDEYAKEFAERQGRYIAPDRVPEKGYYYRSDHFNFAKIGVPALYGRSDIEHWEKGKSYIEEKEAEYLTYIYHKPTDEYLPGSWPAEGLEQDAELLFGVGYKLANERNFPEWSDQSAFKSIREKQR